MFLLQQNGICFDVLVFFQKFRLFDNRLYYH